MRASILPALCAAAWAAACVRSPDPLTFTEDAVSVHAVLRSSDTEARVWLQHVTPSGSVPVAGAAMSLQGGGATVALGQVGPDGAEGCVSSYLGPVPPGMLDGCFGAALPRPVAAGSRWTLSATVPGYGAVTGSTTVPALPEIAQPAAGSRFTYVPALSGPGRAAEIPVAWSAAGAARVEFGLAEGTPFRSGQVVAGAVCHAATPDRPSVLDRSSGTLTLRVYDVWCHDGRDAFQADSSTFALTVTAFDSAYAAYALHGGSTSRGRSGRGLAGAYGVFGGAATERRTVVLVPAR